MVWHRPNTYFIRDPWREKGCSCTSRGGWCLPLQGHKARELRVVLQHLHVFLLSRAGTDHAAGSRWPSLRFYSWLCLCTSPLGRQKIWGCSCQVCKKVILCLPLFFFFFFLNTASLSWNKERSIFSLWLLSSVTLENSFFGSGRTNPMEPNAFGWKAKHPESFVLLFVEETVWDLLLRWIFSAAEKSFQMDEALNERTAADGAGSELRLGSTVWRKTCQKAAFS